MENIEETLNMMTPEVREAAGLSLPEETEGETAEAPQEETPAEGEPVEAETEGTETDAVDVESTEKLSEQVEELVDALSSAPGYGTMGDYYNEALGFYVFPSREVLLSFVAEGEANEGWAITLDGHYVPADCLEKYETAYAAENAEEAEAAPTQTELDTLALLEEISDTLGRMEEDDAAFREEIQASVDTCIQKLDETHVLLKDAVAPVLLCAALFLALLCGAKLADIFFGRLKT